MLRLAKIVRFPERHCPSTVVDGADGRLGSHVDLSADRVISTMIGKR